MAATSILSIWNKIWFRKLKNCFPFTFWIVGSINDCPCRKTHLVDTNIKYIYIFTQYLFYLPLHQNMQWMQVLKILPQWTKCCVKLKITFSLNWKIPLTIHTHWYQQRSTQDTILIVTPFNNFPWVCKTDNDDFDKQKCNPDIRKSVRGLRRDDMSVTEW